MHPTPPPGPNQPYGHGQQPHPQQGGYGQPPHPQQGGYGHPPQPQQGGYGYPQPPAPQGPPPPYPAPLAPDTMPGQATTVRVLMFIGGAGGFLYTLFIGGLVLLGVGMGAAASTTASASDMGDPELNSTIGVFAALGIVAALVPLVYGIASTWLAAVMGRRKSGVYWGVIIFNVIAVLILLLGIGGQIYMETTPGGVLPLLFHTVMIGLMFPARVKAFYGS